jgi:hypothetical protein
MATSRKFGSVLALGLLLLAIAGTFCPSFAQKMNTKQMACCASKPCQQSAKAENCCTHIAPNGQQQFKAELTKALNRPQLTPAIDVTSSLPTTYRSTVFGEIAKVEHPTSLPLYTIYHSFLI